jgi:hypothetical protein
MAEIDRPAGEGLHSCDDRLCLHALFDQTYI